MIGVLFAIGVLALVVIPTALVGFFITGGVSPMVLPEGDDHTLHYCEGCGCNHRRLWMTWCHGAYRCVVCCGEKNR